MLTIERSCYNAMVRHVQAVYPEEGCGLLAGHSGRVHHHYPITNSDHSSTTFLMEAREQLTAMLEIEQRGWALLAIYHSHPHSEPYPSPTDIASAYYPDVVQVIVSLKDAVPAVKGFMIRDGRVSPVVLLIV